MSRAVEAMGGRFFVVCARVGPRESIVEEQQNSTCLRNSIRLTVPLSRAVQRSAIATRNSLAPCRGRRDVNGGLCQENSRQRASWLSYLYT